MQYTSADVWRGPIRESPDKIWFQVYSDVEFVQNFTPPDFQAKNLHRQFHLILTVLVRKTQKMSENGEIYTTGKNFTLLPALTAWTNSTSGYTVLLSFWVMKYMSITLIPKHRSRGILTRYSNIPHISSIPHTRILRYALIHVSMHTSGYLRIDHNDSSKPSHRLTNGPEPSKTIESDGSNIKKPS